MDNPGFYRQFPEQEIMSDSEGDKNNEGVQIKLQKLDGGAAASSEEPYDPHDFRNVPVPTTNWETLVHMLKGSLGTGILAMPKAFYNSGTIVGTISTVLIGILCTYCLHILVKAQYELCKRLRLPILTYPESMKKALEMGPNCLKPFAKPSAIIVDVFLIVYQLGICCVYIVFIAKNIKALFDEYVGVMNVRIYMLILLVPLILINYIRNLKKLAPLSAFANAITFVGLSIIMYFIFKEPLEFEKAEYVGELVNYPLFVGTTLFALEAVGVVIALENNMKTPKSFGGYFGVLNQGMVVIVFLYVFVGLFGYVKYLDKSEDSITLNLEQGGLTLTVQLIFGIAILITYALQSYVPVEIIWNSYLKDRFENNPKQLLYEYILRTSLVVVTFALAIAIPNLGDFISLFGALCLSALGISFPGIMEMCVKWPDNFGKFKWILMKDIFLIFLGLVALVIGTYVSLLAIVKGATAPEISESLNSTVV